MSVQPATALSLAALGLAGLSLALHFDRPEPERPPVTPVAEESITPKTDPVPDIQSATLTETEAAKPAPVNPEWTDKIARLERQVQGLQRILRASGLDFAVPLWESQPGGADLVFEQLGKEAAGRAQFEARREELNRQAADLRDSDYARYGAERYRELEELYRSSKPGRGTGTAEEQASRTQALNRMLEEFPEAYETGVAVAEQALHEALNGNTAQVETYLQTLADTSPYANIVTEQGLEAVPTIQTFLARQYIDQNRVEEATVLLTRIAQDYPDSLIVEPSPGNLPSSPRTALEIATELQQQLGVSGNPASPTAQ